MVGAMDNCCRTLNSAVVSMRIVMRGWMRRSRVDVAPMWGCACRGLRCVWVAGSGLMPARARLGPERTSVMARTITVAVRPMRPTDRGDDVWVEVVPAA